MGFYKNLIKISNFQFLSFYEVSCHGFSLTVFRYRNFPYRVEAVFFRRSFRGIQIMTPTPENPHIKALAGYFLECALELMRISAESNRPETSGRQSKTGNRETNSSLLYAVYASDDGTSHLAVCLDDPFCFASGPDRDTAVSELIKLIRKKYDGAQTLDGIEVPDFLPDDI